MTKKYYLIYIVNKRKYIDYKNLLSKCINNSNYFTLLIYLFLLIYNFKILCQASFFSSNRL